MALDEDAALNRSRGSWVTVALAWTPVLIPLFWGIWQTIKKAAVLFR